MNTVSTDLPTDVQEQLQALFDAAQTTLAQRKQELQARHAAAIQKEQAEISNSWAEAMLSLYAALPAWIYPYIQQPSEMYEKRDQNREEYKYGYVSIVVPGCNPIAAWIMPGRAGTVRYEVLQPHMYQDDDTNVWYVSAHTAYPRRNKWDVEQCGDWDIAVTLFRAHEAYLQQLDLEAEVAQRNAYEPETLLVPAPEPEADPAPAAPDTFANAGELLARYASGVNINLRDDIAGIVVVAAQLYAITDQLHRIGDALERVQWS